MNWEDFKYNKEFEKKSKCMGYVDFDFIKQPLFFQFSNLIVSVDRIEYIERVVDKTLLQICNLDNGIPDYFICMHTKDGKYYERFSNEEDMNCRFKEISLILSPSIHNIKI